MNDQAYFEGLNEDSKESIRELARQHAKELATEYFSELNSCLQEYLENWDRDLTLHLVKASASKVPHINSKRRKQA